MAKKNLNGNSSSDMGAGISGQITMGMPAGTVKYHANTDQTIISVTEDKLELCLIKHREVLKSQYDWVAPLSLLISVVTAILTSQFQESFGLSADTWRAVFIMASAGSVFWLAYTIFMLIKNWNKSDLKKLIEILKNTKT